MDFSKLKLVKNRISYILCKPHAIFVPAGERGSQTPF